jgi:hypothetical protein
MNSAVARLIARAHRPAEAGEATAAAAPGSTAPAPSASPATPLSVAPGPDGSDMRPASSDPGLVGLAPAPIASDQVAQPLPAREPTTPAARAAPGSAPLHASRAEVDATATRTRADRAFSQPPDRGDLARDTATIYEPGTPDPPGQAPGHRFVTSTANASLFEPVPSAIESSAPVASTEPGRNDDPPRAAETATMASDPLPAAAVQPSAPDVAAGPPVEAQAPARADSLPPVVIDTIRVEVAAPATAAPDPFSGLRHYDRGITRWGRS